MKRSMFVNCLRHIGWEAETHLVGNALVLKGEKERTTNLRGEHLTNGTGEDHV